MPRSEEWKKNQSIGILKAIEAGKIPHTKDREFLHAMQQKAVAANTGRKRPASLVEKIRLLNLGKKRTPEMVAAMRQRVIDGWANGKYRVHPENRAAATAKIQAARKGWKPSEEQCRRHSEVMTGHRWDDSVVESRAVKMRGRPTTNPKVKKGHFGKRTLAGVLRSPENVCFSFRNLSEFVRSHEHLFDSSDVNWMNSRKHKKQDCLPLLQCRASKGLSSLFYGGIHTRGSWKGWTLVSDVEAKQNLGDDLLDRNRITVQDTGTPGVEAK